MRDRCRILSRVRWAKGHLPNPRSHQQYGLPDKVLLVCRNPGLTAVGSKEIMNVEIPDLVSEIVNDIRTHAEIRLFDQESPRDFAEAYAIQEKVVSELTESGVRLMESIPSLTRKAAKSG